MAWFIEDDLVALAGSRSFQRGGGYLDAVASVDEVPGGVVATVYGTEAYEVRLVDDGGRLDGSCDCPFGVEGNFCKHCVAVGLTLLAEGEEAEGEGEGGEAPEENDKPAQPSAVAHP